MKRPFMILAVAAILALGAWAVLRGRWGAAPSAADGPLILISIDTLRADRFTRATTWLRADDDVRRQFLTEAGWAPDGAHRELDLHGDGSVRVKQVRLHTDVSA